MQFASRSSSPETIRTPAGSVTVVNWDLRTLLLEDKAVVADCFARAWEFLDMRALRETLTSSSKSFFPMSGIEKALKQIEQSPWMNQPDLTLLFESNHVSVLTQSLTKPLHQSLRSDATYLLAGGLGGLGRSIAKLLVSNGVKHLAFLSRSGVASKQAAAFIEELKQEGADARVYRADICDETSLEDVIKRQVAVDMPPIRGVFQCAAVVKDAVFDNMTFSDWDAAFKPKTAGSWNLVRAISVEHDPFFVFLASSAGVIGNRGQANYAAGNFFEDALARHCRLQGRHAVAIDLGPVLGAGMLAEDEDILNILRASGFYGIRHEDFLKVVHHAITMETAPGTPMPAQVTLGVGTGGIIRQNQPADPYWSRTALYTYLNFVDMPAPDLSSAGATLSLIHI